MSLEPGTRVVIYCNNNFANAEEPFPMKLPPASLNLYTYVALYTYGYRNLYELGPLIDVERARSCCSREQPPGARSRVAEPRSLRRRYSASRCVP